MVITLTGFMGSGKSCVGRSLAKRLGVRFVDLDEAVVRRSGLSIASLFENGEATFRAVELETLRSVLSRGRGDTFVLALGGGTLTIPEALSLVLAETTSFYLKASPEVLLERAGRRSESRPLLDSDAEKRLSSREPDYEKAAFTVTVEGKTPQMIAEEIAVLLGKS